MFFFLPKTLPHASKIDLLLHQSIPFLPQVQIFSRDAHQIFASESSLQSITHRCRVFLIQFSFFLALGLIFLLGFEFFMAASANPPANGTAGAQNVGNGAGAAGGGGGDSSKSAQALKHNPAPGLAVEWSPEEQAILEEGLAKYAAEPNLIRYAKIAKQLQEKTVRDVALRCRWMTKKENGKRRKEDMKKKDKKEKVTDSSAKSAQQSVRPNVPPYSLPVIPMDNDDEIPCEAIGGPTGQLLEQNAQVFNQISSNVSSFQIQENINLFCQVRDNILSILNDMNDMPEIMRQMPPLPVKLNEELANSILPRMPMPLQQP